MLGPTIGPAASTSVPMWAMIIGIAAGAILMGASLVLIRSRKGERRMSPTRLTMGVCGLIVGYHVIAWSTPPAWLPLSVPTSFWWLVVLASVVAVAGSLLADRLEGRVTRV